MQWSVFAIDDDSSAGVRVARRPGGWSSSIAASVYLGRLSIQQRASALLFEKP